MVKPDDYEKIGVSAAGDRMQLAALFQPKAAEKENGGGCLRSLIIASVIIIAIIFVVMKSCIGFSLVTSLKATGIIFVLLLVGPTCLILWDLIFS